MLTRWSSLGAWGDRDGLRSALERGSAPLTRLDPPVEGREPGAARDALLVGDAVLAERTPKGIDRRASRLSRMVLAAAAPLMDGSAQGHDDTAVILSTAFGAMAASESVLRSMRAEGPLATSPFTFTESVANAPAGQVAIRWGARGTNVTIVQGECGPLLALHRAAAEIRSGRARRALAGSHDEMTPLLHASLDRLGALSRTERAVPFGLGRDGVLASEGATAILLERRDDAQAAGKPILARLAGSGSAFDASTPRAGWGSGAGHVAEAIRATMARAGCRPDTVGLVVSGASGARGGDRLEAAILRSLWPGEEAPPCVAPKAVVGEWGGGLLAATAALLAGATPARAHDALDPAVAPFFRERERVAASPRTAPHVLVTSLAAGGGAAWLLLDRSG